MLRAESEREFSSKRRSTRRISRVRGGDGSRTASPRSVGRSSRITTRVNPFTDSRADVFAGQANAGTGLLEPLVVDVRKEKAFEVRSHMKLAAAADVVYDVLKDYDNLANVFKGFQKVDVEKRGSQVFMQQHCSWRFLAFTGNYTVKLQCRESPLQRRLDFWLSEPGFMRAFKGHWQVEPLLLLQGGRQLPPASHVRLHQDLIPTIPSGPVAGVVVRMIRDQVTRLMNDLSFHATLRQLQEEEKQQQQQLSNRELQLIR
eukprot:TRINITY_DN1037_c0_g1_i1.p1 TRINITY_DN1037_c0_g1~~TRINITY_DN1037_c0_g1_i1.p1  ORF type:complete len:259 (+),score=55.76 TRINITY_DN1037_c0_g1_i1:172-948(+)